MSINAVQCSRVLVGCLLLVQGCSPDLNRPDGNSDSAAALKSARLTRNSQGEVVASRAAPAPSIQNEDVLYTSAVANDGSVRVGVKAAGTTRGFWHGEVLIGREEKDRILKALRALEGVELAKEDPLLPAFVFRVHSRDALKSLRSHPNVDYVVPVAVLPSDFSPMDGSGCSIPSWAGGALTLAPIGGGDYISSAHQEIRVDRAWLYGLNGWSVTMGWVDTGADNSGTWPELSGMYGRLSVLSPNDAGSCHHGNRMISVAAGAINGV